MFHEQRLNFGRSDTKTFVFDHFFLTVDDVGVALSIDMSDIAGVKPAIAQCTGDIGHVDAEGYTYIVDRKKEMIKYKGFGIAPAEIESLLMEHPAVMDSAVIGVPDDEAGELAKGFVVIHPDHSATPEELPEFANGKLA